mmetsp:Transcript_10640/g.18585  ORF Transcript_10640/g.18585 Transcript_10640/m.18585 type:complete len:220 (-) Transcript_10640:133-792(-)
MKTHQAQQLVQIQHNAVLTLCRRGGVLVRFWFLFVWCGGICVLRAVAFGGQSFNNCVHIRKPPNTAFLRVKVDRNVEHSIQNRYDVVDFLWTRGAVKHSLDVQLDIGRILIFVLFWSDRRRKAAGGLFYIFFYVFTFSFQFRIITHVLDFSDNVRNYRRFTPDKSFFVGKTHFHVFHVFDSGNSTLHSCGTVLLTHHAGYLESQVRRTVGSVGSGHPIV